VLSATSYLFGQTGCTPIGIEPVFESALSHCHARTMHLPSRLGIVRIGVRFAHSNLTSPGPTAGAFSCKGIFELEKSVAKQTDAVKHGCGCP